LRKPTVRSTTSLVVSPVSVVLIQTLYTVELAITSGMAARGKLGRMALLRVDARPLLPRLRGELTALLASLPDGDWAHPTRVPAGPSMTWPRTCSGSSSATSRYGGTAGS
jgi:hypothetical protein